LQIEGRLPSILNTLTPNGKGMKTRSLSRAQVRDVDRRAIAEYSMSGLVLMENAGRGCADTLVRLGCRGPVVIACGRGNNAGDGFVIARHLDLRGVPVRVLVFGRASELEGDAAANYAILAKCGVPIVELSSKPTAEQIDRELHGVEWLVDALLGTGAVGNPRFPMDLAIQRMNASPAKKLAVDLPSGLDCDSGQPAEPTFRADHTCTFVARKIGFDNPLALPWLGQMHVLDIGAPRTLVESIVS
jgi:NAD(P)H-hydrate epimerase